MKDSFADILMQVDIYFLSGLRLYHSIPSLLLEFLLKNMLILMDSPLCVTIHLLKFSIFFLWSVYLVF
jgi:hypothetical protein